MYSKKKIYIFKASNNIHTYEDYRGDYFIFGT